MRRLRVRARIRTLLIAVALIAVVLVTSLRAMDNLRRFQEAYFPSKTDKPRR